MVELVAFTVAGVAVITWLVLDGHRRAGLDRQRNSSPRESTQTIEGFSDVNRGRVPPTADVRRCWCGNDLANSLRTSRLTGLARHWCDRCGRWSETTTRSN